MTSLMGLLLRASPQRRRELARRWGLDDETGAGQLVTALYQRITDDSSLRLFLERLALEQRMVLQHVIASPSGEIPVVRLLNRLPIDEPRGRAAIAALLDAALLHEQPAGDSLAVPSDLVTRLRHSLAPAAATPLTSGRTPPSLFGSHASAERQRPALAIVAAPCWQTPATDSLREDLDRLLEAAANGRLAGAGRDRSLQGRPESAPAGASEDDRLASARVRYGMRCARLLGLLTPETGRLRCGSSAAQWRTLTRETQARVLYELWLSDRNWREPPTTPGRRALLPPASVHRLRQQACLLLAGASPGNWHSTSSLLGPLRLAGTAAKESRRAVTAAKAESVAEVVAAIVTVGFHWLGGVDVGHDEQGRRVAFRLTERGYALLRRSSRPRQENTDGVVR